MKNKKKTGSYYTPDFLSEFITRYVANSFCNCDYLSILEPSVGDGSFARAFNKTKFPSSIKNFSFTAVDKILPELRKAQAAALLNRKGHTKYSFSKIDFLKYQASLNRRFSLILGNPPYLKKGLLNKTQINYCKNIHMSANLADRTVKNIWSAFLVRCTQLLNENGVLAFVLPAELLQVKFSSELRTYLIQQFERVEVFTFDDLLFECKGQDTVLLIGFKQHAVKGQFYAHIKNTEELLTNNFNLTQNHALSNTETKWNHHLISEDDLVFLHNVSSRLNKINHYCDSKPGIVTAANSFFIVNQNTELQYNLTEYAHPIIQKGLFVNGSIVFDEADYQNLISEGKPTKILCFSDADAERLPAHIEEYLKLGIELNLPQRHKCIKRKNWFVVPNISTIPQGFFFKRSHNYPKLLKNNAGVFVTDSGYKIEMKGCFSINHLIYSFYNSLTLAFSELTGRSYGGGVLELTPLEFKNLPIPNVAIGNEEFNSYTRKFEIKTTISEVLKANDWTILNTSLSLTIEEVSRIQRIYTTLKTKRLRRTNDVE